MPTTSSSVSLAVAGSALTAACWLQASNGQRRQKNIKKPLHGHILKGCIGLIQP